MAGIGPSISISSVGPGGVREIGYSNFYCTGQTPWGLDSTFQVCTSFQDFLRKYGGLSKLASVASGVTADTYTTETTASVQLPYYAVKGFFDEKQSNSPGVLFFNRTVASSSGPTAASKTFPDSTGGNNTTITSRWKGVPGATIQATIINPSPRAGIFAAGAGTVTVTSGSASVTGSGTAFTAGMVGYGIKIGTEYYTIATYTSGTAITITPVAVSTHTADVYSTGVNTTTFYVKLYHPQANITEEWDISNATDAANVSKKSELVTITLPAGGQLPQTAAASKLNSGTAATADPYTASDSDLIGTTTTAGVKTGIQVFNDQKLGTGFVAVPGKYSATVRSGIATHCAAYFRMGLLGAPSGLNLTSVQTDLSGTSTNGPDLVYYWPQVWVADQNSNSGGSLLVDPVGHMAGLYARMDRDYRGPHKSAAGITHPLVAVLDVERASGTAMELCDDSGSQTLADSLINTIRLKGNPPAVCGWGMRTLSQDNRYRQAPVRRILQLIYLTTFLALEQYTFEPIDSRGDLFARVKGDIDTFLDQLLRQGTLYGNAPGKDPRADDAFYVVCNSSNNPGPAIASGELHVDVSFVPTFNAERITENLFLTTPGFVGRSQ